MNYYDRDGVQLEGDEPRRRTATIIEVPSRYGVTTIIEGDVAVEVFTPRGKRTVLLSKPEVYTWAKYYQTVAETMDSLGR